MSGELATALAAFQAELPKIRKAETAKVEKKAGGFFTYTYATLSDVSDAVLPALAKHGLSFTATPTVRDNGQFVLEYALLHSSGEREEGSYPLPSTGTPQQIGSAITYGKRYCLTSVTGVAPDDDDDGAAASQQPAHQDAPAPERTPGEQACATAAADLRLSAKQVMDWFQTRYGRPFVQGTDEQKTEHAQFMRDNPPTLAPDSQT